MATAYDIDQGELVKEAAKELKNIDAIKPPAWAIFVKTGHFKERPPVENDWWYARAASVLRTVYRLGPIGTSKLRTKYGGKKNRGVAKEKFYKGSGNIIRKVLQQLEKAGMVTKAAKGVHKGRVVTNAGRSFLDKIANNISTPLKKQAPVTAQQQPAEVKGENAAEEKQQKPAAKKSPKASA